MPKLTKRIVDQSPAPTSKPIFVWDDQIPGFGLKVLPSGVKKYFVKYRTAGGGRKVQQRWYSLGVHGAITCDQARELAAKTMALVAAGNDPQADKFTMRRSSTFNELWSRYSRDQLPLKKSSTVGDYCHLWAVNISPELGHRTIISITRQDIDRLHKSHKRTPYQANRTVALLSRLFTLAEAWGVIPQGSNPARYIERFKETSRERYLSFREISTLGQTIDELSGKIAPEAQAALKLLLFTGARLNEILTARREWVDLGRRVIELPDSKTGKKTIFLSEPACKIIRDLLQTKSEDNPFLLSGKVIGKPLHDLKGPWKLVREKAGLHEVRIHDLRHTMASIAVGQGGSLAIIGRLLGHSHAQTTLRYAHVDCDPALVVADQVGVAIETALCQRERTSGSQSIPREQVGVILDVPQ